MKLAINICYLLPEDLVELCIQTNSKFEKIRFLGRDDHVPHMTLAMGIVDEKHLDSIKSFLQSLKILELSLTIETIKHSADYKSSFEVVNTPELQKFHETIMEFMSPLFEDHADGSMLYLGDETGLSETSKGWFETYSKRTAFGNYWPHVTLQCYSAECADLPISFTVNNTGLFHAGDGGTCRKLIARYSDK